MSRSTVALAGLLIFACSSGFAQVTCYVTTTSESCQEYYGEYDEYPYYTCSGCVAHECDQRYQLILLPQALWDKDGRRAEEQEGGDKDDWEPGEIVCMVFSQCPLPCIEVLGQDECDSFNAVPQTFLAVDFDSLIGNPCP